MEINELDAALEDLDQRLERLRSLYEQYFLGIEKIEPTIARKDVDRRFWQMRREKLRNTARRFRLQLLVQRYNTFQQYWVRICRQIENGTYSRHLIKAEAAFGKEALTFASQRRGKALAKAREAGPASSRLPNSTRLTAASPNPAPAPDPALPPVPVINSSSSLHTRPTTKLPAIPPKLGAAPSSGQLPPIAAPPASSASTPASQGLSPQRIQELHAQLNAEKKKLADTSSVSLDTLSKSLREASEQLRSIHGDRTVDFRVVIKGGKAMVKPVLR